MPTSDRWIASIRDACAEPDPVRSNQLITTLHYLLSEALADSLGREGGPNFHSWAVWGSRKAGVTIRQEDLDSAIANATITSGLVGSVIGTAAGFFAGHSLGFSPAYFTAAIGAAIGILTSGFAGRALAIRSRANAAKLMLLGNQIVIQDIGEQSARFLSLLESGASSDARDAFFAGLRTGPTERHGLNRHGQDRLAAAFRCYLAAFDTDNLEAKRAAMIAGNCEIVYHEHIRLEPYIRGAMPIVIRRFATKKLMTYKIGERALTVANDIPGISMPTAARNWAKFEQRMRYVFALFRILHTAPEVFSTPYAEMEMVRITKSLHSSQA